MTRRTAREVIVLLRGFVQAIDNARSRASGTVTLITGSPIMIVDTGAPEQRQELLEALRSHGVDPEQVAYVVNTHGHLDHVGNNNLFPHATFVLDTDLARDGEYWSHDFGAGPLLIEGLDGAGPVTVMATPGHTDHDLSVLVRTDAGEVAVVGDLFEYGRDAEDGAWRRWSRDVPRQEASREHVIRLADYIVPGHGDIFRSSRGSDAS